MDSNKLAQYHYAIEIATNNIWAHLERRLEEFPDVVTHLSDSQLDVILDVLAAEREWLLDPKQHQDVSLIQPNH